MNPQRDEFNEGGNDANPFSADLNSAFHSGAAAGNTQLFREGGMPSGQRRKVLSLGALVAVLAVGGYLYYAGYFGGGHGLTVSDHDGKDDMDDDFSDDKAKKEIAAKKAALASAANQAAEAKKAAEKPVEHAADAMRHVDHMQNDVKKAPAGKIHNDMSLADYQNQPEAKPVHHRHHRSHAHRWAKAKAPAVIRGPSSQSRIDYDEALGFAELTWEGPGDYVLMSRNENMQPIAEKFEVSGSSFKVHNPYPGRWYWQVQNKAGLSKVSSFNVAAPARRAISLTSQKEGDTIEGNGGVIHWTGDTKVSYYRVELSQDKWTNPPFRFATSGTQLAIRGVPAGSYKLRLGGFSESSGRWEYTQPIAVTIH